MTHSPQLDGLRALAVGHVLLWHYWPGSPGLSGHRGVQLFFVLSGFLITRILLDGRHLVASGAAPSRAFVLRHFYFRRLLRIAPAYYLVLFALALTPSSDVQASFWYHFFYLTNFYFAAVGEWQPWPTAHLWTLATEEQFYLAWPALILLLPIKWVGRAVICTVVASVVFRAMYMAAGVHSLVIWVVPWISFDALGLGGLLAVVANTERRRTLEVAACISAAAILLLEVAVRVGLVQPSASFGYVATEFAWSLAFVGLVSRASDGFQGPVGRFLASKPLVYTGRISYGIYLYHAPVLFYLYLLAARQDLPFPQKGPLTFVIASSVTLLVAAISFRWFENPINEFKRWFPYRATLLGTTLASSPSESPVKLSRGVGQVSGDEMTVNPRGPESSGPSNSR